MVEKKHNQKSQRTFSTNMSSAKNLSLRDYEDYTEQNQKKAKSRNASSSIVIQTAPAAATDQHNLKGLEVGAATISDNQSAGNHSCLMQ